MGDGLKHMTRYLVRDSVQAHCLFSPLHLSAKVHINYQTARPILFPDKNEIILQHQKAVKVLLTKADT